MVEMLVGEVNLILEVEVDDMVEKVQMEEVVEEVVEDMEFLIMEQVEEELLLMGKMENRVSA